MLVWIVGTVGLSTQAAAQNDTLDVGGASDVLGEPGGLRVFGAPGAPGAPGALGRAPGRAPGLELLPPRAAVQSIDSLLDEARADEALEWLERALHGSPHDVELRWRAAWAATLVGLLSPTLRGARPHYRRAIEHADQALALAPEHLDARTWALAARGRLALWAGARETAQLAEEIWQSGHELLALDENHAIAHHALGMLHYKVMSLNGFVRSLGRMLVGGDALAQASWDDALRHLERATELEPANRIFGLALAQAHVDHGDREAGYAELERVRALPIRTPLDERFQYWSHMFAAEEFGGGG